MKKSPPQFGFIPLAASPQRKGLDSLMAEYLPALEKHGGRRWTEEMISQPGPLFLFVLTGGTEEKILRLREKRREIAPDEPLFLLAHPGNNSLPASLEVLARLRQDGTRGKIIYLRGPEDTSGWNQISQAAGDLEAFQSLRQSRIGLVGQPSDWLVASSPDPHVVRKVWGPEVVAIDFGELIDSIQTISEEAVQPWLDSLISQATQVQEPSQTELQDATRVYLALRQLVDRHRLRAIAVRCFDLIGRLKTTGCFALAQLNDQGIIAGCEGDLACTVSMLWIHELLDQSSWMANPAQLNPENNTLWLAHCTVPRGMVRQYRLRSHFESGLGMGIQGELPAGPATLLRIGGRSMEQIWLAEGEILRAGQAENLCRTQAQVRLRQGGQVAELLSAPLGNHLVLVRGHHAARLRGWWEMMIAGE